MLSRAEQGKAGEGRAGQGRAEQGRTGHSRAERLVSKVKFTRSHVTTGYTIVLKTTTSFKGSLACVRPPPCLVYQSGRCSVYSYSGEGEVVSLTHLVS